MDQRTQLYDRNWYQHIGWSQQTQNNDQYKNLFSKETLTQCQQKITQLLEGIRDRPILVPLETIGHVISSCYETRRQYTSDMYSKYIQEETHIRQNDIRDIIDRAINIIVTQISTEMKMEDNNNRLSVWNSVYGDFNSQGLRAHSQIKVRKRRPEAMQFHMRY